LAPDFVSPGGWQAPPMAARHSHLVNREQRARVADLVRVIAAAAAVVRGRQQQRRRREILAWAEVCRWSSPSSFT